ncbi:MAG: hypothetical protein N3C12_04380 [Candidatus Binatia bacterium]|nr:hypothetical protein [Candidatus Binatia bacterium]
MDVEVLLGLQQAYADLSRALDEARVLLPIQDWLSHHALPRAAGLGRDLRQAQRRPMSEGEIERFARELHGLLQAVRLKTDEVCAAPLYAAARAALYASDFARAEALLPSLFADVERVLVRPSCLLVPVDPSRRVRRPGQSPFPAPRELAEELCALFSHGLPIRSEPGSRWLVDFPWILAAGAAGTLACPIWLVCDARRVQAAVLADRREPGCFRLYGTVIRSFVAVGIASRADDEWWFVQDPPFEHYRQVLIEELHARNLPVESVAEI